MKKKFLVIATAVACMFGFTACDQDTSALQDAAHQLAGQNMLGHIYLVPSDHQSGTMFMTNHAAVNVDTMKFKSAVCNARFTYEGNLSDSNVAVNAGALFVGTYSDMLAEATGEINFPMVGMNLRDTVPGDYAISDVTGDFSFVSNLNDNNWKYYLTHNDVQYGNIMIVAVSEDDYYVCYEGNIHIAKFDAIGSIVEGAVQNAKAYYVTKAQLQILLALPQTQRDYLYNLLPHVTFNGEISSRRANINDVINALEEAE